MQISVLEYPTLVGRALMMAGMPPGTIQAASRLVLWRELAYGDGLACLERHLPELERASFEPHRIIEGPDGTLSAKVGGASMLLVGPGALDLATAAVRRSGRGVVRIAGATGGAFAEGLAPWALQRGLEASVRIESRADSAAGRSGDVVLICTPAGRASAGSRASEDEEARHAHATRDGIDINDGLWRRLRAYGDRVLIPPSERSRRDAG